MKMREPFLDEKSFVEMLKFEQQEVIPKLQRALEAKSASLEALANIKRRLFHSLWEITVLGFSGGADLPSVAIHALAAVDAFVLAVDDDHSSLDHVDLATQDVYVEALWLLSLAKLLGLGDKQIERIAESYAADETNDGADELFEIILAKLGRKSFDAEGLIHEDPYQLLLDCIKAAPQERPALMTQFLKRWFKGQKECDWWGSHIPRKGTTVLDTGFFGYWAFEAALVTYLWDIDDSSYRDLPHYPKDLIDFARANSVRAVDDKGPSRVPSGQPCPRTGYWFTPARENSRTHFEAGQAMPDVGGTWGATIWQWDEQQ